MAQNAAFTSSRGSHRCSPRMVVSIQLVGLPAGLIAGPAVNLAPLLVIARYSHCKVALLVTGIG